MGIIGAIWGIFGVLLLLGSALWRLTPMSIEAFEHNFTTLHWIVLVVNVVFMAYAEGYKGFQKAWAPRTAARARWLKDHPSVLNVLLAPCFLMGYYGTTKKRKIVAWCLTLGIIGLIILVHQTVQPWRGIIDTGVVVGLSWGTLSLLCYLVKAFTGKEFEWDPEVV